jgi:hypothetical protein
VTQQRFSNKTTGTGIRNLLDKIFTGVCINNFSFSGKISLATSTGTESCQKNTAGFLLSLVK